MIALALAALLVPVSPASVDLIVRYEVGSRALYEAKYQRPVCPGLYSGPTIGIGSDLGTQTAATIRQTWAQHPQVDCLVLVAGQTGDKCKPALTTISHVLTSWPLAIDVFQTVELVRYWRVARRAFGDGFAHLSRNAQGALTSVVYNRGGGMAGPSRSEMRHIRDICIPARDERCIADQITSMTRLWSVRGLINRRIDEAALLRGES